MRTNCDLGQEMRFSVMASHPDFIQINDLLQPQFPEGVEEALNATEKEAGTINWSVNAVKDHAMKATGLDDFGDNLIDQPLEILTAIGDSIQTFRPSGKVSFWNTLVANASQRLLLVDYINRNPEIHEIEIKSPIIIAGQPRTGTTHLHNLIAADPSLRSLQYWESIEPVPPREEQGKKFPIDPRYQRTETNLAGLNYALPHFRRMHDMYAAHVHEEIQLMMPAFGSMLWETTLCDDRYRDWYIKTDQTPWYQWMKTVLKVCTHIGGGERWILKSPQHVEQFQPLLTTFPDAVFLCTHRDPVSVAQSLSTMITYTARTSTKPEHLRDVGRYWVERSETMFRKGAEDRHILPPSQSMDVRFHEFMANDVAMVERIYEFADQPFTPEVQKAMNTFMQEHPRGKYGRLTYDITQFGYETAERKEALRFYIDQFELREENPL